MVSPVRVRVPPPLFSSNFQGLFYLRIALKHFGYAGEVKTFPDPDEMDLLARVRLGREQEATEEEQRLFRAILDVCCEDFTPKAP